MQEVGQRRSGCREPFDKNIVQCPPAPVHADFDAFVQRPGKAGRSELRTLVGVEDFALLAFGYSADGFNAEIRIQGGAQRPAQDVPAVPVNHGHQVNKARCQPDIGDIGAPHLVATVNHQTTQQVGVDLMFRVPLAGVGFLVHRLQPHYPQQTPDPLGVHSMPQVAQIRHHFQYAITGCPGVLFVQKPHQNWVFLPFTDSLVVQRRAVQSRQAALMTEAELRVLWVKPALPCR